MKIYQVELTNKCNYICDYCPRSEMTRPLGIMSKDVFQIAMLKAEGPYIRLHHYGESLLDNELEDKLSEALKRNNIKAIVNTNGSLLTADRVKSLFDSGIYTIALTYHNENSIKHINDIPEKYRSRIEILRIVRKDEDLSYLINLGYKVNKKRLRDLGQIKRTKIIQGNPIDRCSFLKNNEVAVLWDGRIVPCCECYDDKFVIGDILKDDYVENKPFDFCKTCLGYGNDGEETERKKA